MGLAAAKQPPDRTQVNAPPPGGAQGTDRLRTAEVALMRARIAGSDITGLKKQARP